MPRKMGRRQTIPDHEGIRLFAQAVDSLPPAPDTPTWHYPFGPIPMFLNDELECCTASSKAIIDLHMSRVLDPKNPVVWPNDNVLNLYERTSNYIEGNRATDNGAIMADVNIYMSVSGEKWDSPSGVVAAKWDGAIGIDPSEPEHIAWGVELFGAVDCGWDLTQAMYDAVDHSVNGFAYWTSFSDASIGGHDAAITCHRRVNGEFWFLLETWTARIWVPAACVRARLQEAYAPIDRGRWLNAKGLSPGGKNFNDLLNYAEKIGQ